MRQHGSIPVGIGDGLQCRVTLRKDRGWLKDGSRTPMARPYAGKKLTSGARLGMHLRQAQPQFYPAVLTGNCSDYAKTATVASWSRRHGRPHPEVRVFLFIVLKGIKGIDLPSLPRTCGINDNDLVPDGNAFASYPAYKRLAARDWRQVKQQHFTVAVGMNRDCLLIPNRRAVAGRRFGTVNGHVTFTTSIR